MGRALPGAAASLGNNGRLLRRRFGQAISKVLIAVVASKLSPHTLRLQAKGTADAATPARRVQGRRQRRDTAHLATFTHLHLPRATTGAAFRAANDDILLACTARPLGTFAITPCLEPSLAFARPSQHSPDTPQLPIAASLERRLGATNTCMHPRSNIHSSLDRTAAAFSYDARLSAHPI